MTICSDHDLFKDDTVFVGDMGLAKIFGIDLVLMMTGFTSKEGLDLEKNKENGNIPNYVCENLKLY